MFVEFLETPIGCLKLEATDSHLVGCRLVMATGENRPNPVTNLAKNQLFEYFQGKRTNFTVPLMPTGTAFAQAVWRCLLEVPFGTSTTYGDLAACLGRPKACRAIGTAVGKNPLLVFIPCHRVLPKAGGLGGFSAGVENKAILTKLENI